MAKTKKQGENSACSALFERAYYSSGYGICHIFLINIFIVNVVDYIIYNFNNSVGG